jgi:ACR3 family arsenite transporter
MSFRDRLERHQVAIYLCVVALAAIAAAVVPTSGLGGLVEPALALMLFATFLQVPLAELGRAILRGRFIAVLAVANFLAVPVLVLMLLSLAPADPLVRLGVLMVLLAPCVDYVVTFSQIGRADARALLAATPLLLVIQMLALPIYFGLFLDAEAAGLVRVGPFLDAFLWLIVVPLVAAGLVQFLAARNDVLRGLKVGLDYLPVPATALVLFLVVASVVPQLGVTRAILPGLLPVYVIFAVVAPALGWGVAQLFGLDASLGRAVAFSAGTRNSLVILPLALAVPGGAPLLPAVIVAQTLVELVASLAYMKIMPRLGRDAR